MTRWGIREQDTSEHKYKEALSSTHPNQLTEKYPLKMTKTNKLTMVTMMKKSEKEDHQKMAMPRNSLLV